MNFENVTVVRIYLTEGEGQIDSLIKRLHDWEKVRGVTVFRGILGFGEDGIMHPAGMIDLSMDLPVVIEFFDSSEKVDRILEHLTDQIKPGHIVRWIAEVNA